MNHDYITNAIAALFRLRHETDKSLENFGDRFDAVSVDEIKKVEQHDGAHRTSILRLRKFTDLFNTFTRNIILAGRLARKVREFKEIEIVGISLKRLPIPLNDTALRSLETLTFTNKGVPLVRSGGGLTILLDPANSPPTQEDRLPENVVLATPVSIIFATLPRLLLTMFTEVWPLYLSIRSRAPEVPRSAAFPMCLCVVAMESLFRVHASIQYTLTTSNSVLLESTRFWAMQSDCVVSVREIMHGIPVPAVDRYFGSLSNEARNQLELVRQVPLSSWQTPERTLSDGLLFCNLAVNKMFLLNIGNYTEWTINNMEEYIRKETQKKDKNSCPIIFFGGNHSSEPFFQSKNFLVERRILAQLRSTISELRPNAHIVYLPHPGHGKLNSSAEDVIFQFVDEISYNSQPWYFAACYAAGLYSSGLFELAALGAKVFSPVLPSDEIYHSAMMTDMLTFPTGPGPEAMADSLFDLVSSSDQPVDGVRLRLRTLYPTIN